LKDFSKKKKKKAARGARKKRREKFDFISFIRKGLRLFLISSGVFAGGVMAYGSLVFIVSSDFFRLSDVVVEGNIRASRSEILVAAGIDSDTNTLLLHVGETGKMIEAVPWIRSVSVEKRLPNSLRINVKERKPIALVHLEDYYYIDEEGYIFARADRASGWNYPVLTGIDRQTLLDDDDESISLLDEGVKLIKYLDSREGYISWGRVSEALLDRKSGITIYTTFGNGTPIHLGRGEFTGRVIRSEKVLADLKMKGKGAVGLEADFDDRVLVKTGI